jgi:hypothetical protein
MRLICKRQTLTFLLTIPLIELIFGGTLDFQVAALEQSLFGPAAGD